MLTLNLTEKSLTLSHSYQVRRARSLGAGHAVRLAGQVAAERAQGVTAAGGEVVLLHLLTPEEMDPPAEARLAVDPENATLRRSLDADGRRAYAGALEAWLDRMQQEYRGAGVHYVRALSSEPPERIVRRVAAPDAPTDA